MLLGTVGRLMVQSNEYERVVERGVLYYFSLNIFKINYANDRVIQMQIDYVDFHVGQ